MILRKYFFHKVAIVGVGLMGGSFGLALKKHKLAKEVVGLSQHQSSVQAALKNQAVDEATTDVKRALQNADLVVMAAPVQSIMHMFSVIAPHLKRGAIVIDLGSTKTAIIDAAQKNLPNYTMFVGCHPLAGSEKHGVDFANADLFTNAMCLITPTDKTHFVAREKIKHLWGKMGAVVKIISPEEHDAILGYISHLPHMVAYALMNAVPNDYLSYATQGLKDTTRIASSSPKMWNDVCMTNSKHLLKALDEYVKILSQIRKSIATHDEQLLTGYFESAKAKRDGIRNNE